MCCHFKHYAQVRGFPKRAGAEDFYLLNKLAKTGRVESLSSPAITLTARVSNRVPFGTGPAVEKLQAMDKPMTLALFHPDCFRYLKFFITVLKKICDQPQSLEKVVLELSDQEDAEIDCQYILSLATYLHTDKAIDHCNRHGKTADIRWQQMSHWFDGFKTLKTIHYLRDSYFGTIKFEHWRDFQNDYRFFQSAQLQLLIADIDQGYASKD